MSSIARKMRSAVGWLSTRVVTSSEMATLCLCQKFRDLNYNLPAVSHQLLDAHKLGFLGSKTRDGVLVASSISVQMMREHRSRAW